MSVVVETNDDNVFCVDCKYSTGGNFLLTWWDRLTKSADMECTKDAMVRSRVNLITGKIIMIKTNQPLCREQRDSNYQCGEKGRYWVPYNKHKMFLYLKRTGNNDQSN